MSITAALVVIARSPKVPAMTIFPLLFRCNDIGSTKTSLDRGDVWPVPLRSLTLAGVNTPEKHTRRRRIHFDTSADLSYSYACGATPIAGGETNQQSAIGRDHAIENG